MNTILQNIDTHGVGTITLNRPEQHNAFDDHMVNELTKAVEAMKNNPVVRILLLKSTGKSFSAGADLQWMRKMAQFSPDENFQDAHALGKLLFELYHFPKPTIAMVQGPAFGGGIGLIACCHIVIASREASFCFSETKLGLIPAIISPYIINAIGVRQARAYFLSAKTIAPPMALQLGLCHEVVEPVQLPKRALEWIHLLLQNGPHALQEVNQLLNRLQPFPITLDMVTETSHKIAALRASSEGQEGLNAFLEKRKPNWIRD
jgi:methylglutaconyl-CoA hydratase